MKVTVITLFPEMVEAFFHESIVKRAQEKKLVEIKVVNLRDFTKDKHKTVDGRPYGGGAGMVLKVEPIFDALKKIKKQKSKLEKKVVMTSPRGKKYSQKKAQEYAKLNHLVIVAGHYEGVDERIVDYIDEEVSIGDYVLTGGEIAVAAIVDSVVRLIPGVLKKAEAPSVESFFVLPLTKVIEAVPGNRLLKSLQKKGKKKVALLEYPHFTRPEEFQGKKIPLVLLSGNHAEIEKWRIREAFKETQKRRKDLLV